MWRCHKLYFWSITFIGCKNLWKNEVLQSFSSTEFSILCYLRNRKHVPCFYRVFETRVKGRTRNTLGTRAAGECFHSHFEFSQTFMIKNPCFIRVYNIKRRVSLFSPHYLSKFLFKTAKTHFLWRNLWLSFLRNSRKFWRRGLKHSSVIKLRQFVDLCALIFLLVANKIYIIQQTKKPCITLR